MDNITIYNDITYGNHERHKLDIFVPKNVKSDSGIILFIHGGGWTMGDKSVHHSDCEYFSNLGYICATMNYRYVDENTVVYDELDDITSALKAIKSRCKESGFDIKKAILSGGSAGGHLSLFYAYKRKDEAGIMPVAVCAYCPAVDCTTQDFLLGVDGESEFWKYIVLSRCCGIEINKENLMNPEQQEALRMISPENYISENCVPTAVFHGKQDELVPFNHTLKFINKLNETGIRNNLVIYENSGHALDKDPDAALQARKVFADYAEMYL